MWLLVVYGVLGTVAVFLLIAATEVWLDHRRERLREKTELEHKYRMKKLEMEERWLEVAERDYDDRN
ncbi:hypothetical protein [Haloferax larsenii]|uniref:Uncharacterized protein n=1 Tax=Haloferax larsenii TaxID=302484 RepID=A0A1H7N8I9_HALLR|nr:hypothetical protein [Haloferax larsenii]SEL19601.1 hypothetical protein SAMN04488691_103218 [Haloferax larsenii]